MVSTHKKRQSNGRLFSQLDDFGQDIIIGNSVTDRLESARVIECTGSQDFTAGTSCTNLLTNKFMVNVKTLEKCYNDKNGRELSNIVDTVEDRIQNAILMAIDNIIAPKIQLVVRSINGSSGRDMASTRTKSKRKERVGIIATFETASENNIVLHASNMTHETLNTNPDEVNEVLVSGKRLTGNHTLMTSSNATNHNLK